jgi:hypothetical protein
MYHSHGSLLDEIEDTACGDAICTVTKFILGVWLVLWFINSV